MNEKVDFTGVQSTMLVTLYLKAVESRSEDSILCDHAAAAAVDRIDCDFDKLLPRGGSGNRFLLALRAKQLDDWAAGFLARHPDATVLHLGCGLDTRAFRLAETAGGGGSRRRRERGCGGRPPQASMDLPDDARWFDVDLPDVIELRRKLYDEHDGYRMIGASVTDPEWLEEIPAGGPALIVAEGLLMYLTGSDTTRLLGRFADRFDTGEMLFDGMAPWVVQVSKFYARKGYPVYSTAMRDGRELERWDSRFRYIEDVPVVSLAATKVPVRGYRIAYRLTNAMPATRKMMRVFRYEF